jgi:hypothetical protein
MSITPAEFAEKMLPEDTMTSRAMRAVIVEAITKYEAEKTGETPLAIMPTSDLYLSRINAPSELEDFRAVAGMRTDWHEPDEQDVTAYVIGDHLDNAFGPTVDRNHGELNVVLARRSRNAEGYVLHPQAVVNLATLLGWATDYARFLEDTPGNLD